MNPYRLIILSVAGLALTACDPNCEFPDGEDDDADGYLSSVDCDDDNASVHPAADEIAYDGVDQDCSGADLTDVDGDGYDATEAGGDDCDDMDLATNPASVELCDDIDNNCDGQVDEDGASDAESYYPDTDGDGFGDPLGLISACSQPDGHVPNPSDCDDNDAEIHPGTTLEMLDIDMVFLCDGTFEMGSPLSEVGRESHERLHTVSLTHPFYMGRTEVTHEQFASVMGYNPSETAGTCPGDCAVENIDWSQAAAFANELSEQLGLPMCFLCTGEDQDVICDYSRNFDTPYDCPGFRLPTEAEWEYGARAGESAAMLSGGNLADEDDFYYCDGDLILDNGSNLDDHALYCGSSGLIDTPVASRLPNNWGLYGMAGTMLEWTGDLYIAILYDETDPVGAEGPGYTDRVFRSGCYWFAPKHSRSADRGYINPNFFYSLLGMRLAITQTPALMNALASGVDTSAHPDDTANLQ